MLRKLLLIAVGINSPTAHPLLFALRVFQIISDVARVFLNLASLRWSSSYLASFCKIILMDHEHTRREHPIDIIYPAIQYLQDEASIPIDPAVVQAMKNSPYQEFTDGESTPG